MTNHTPTPWRIVGDTIQNDEYIICDLPTIGDGAAPQTEANAAFIVKAVNCHDELLAIAKRLSDTLATYQLGWLKGNSNEALFLQGDFNLLMDKFGLHTITQRIADESP